MKKTKFIILILFLIIGLTTLGACGSSEDGKTPVKSENNPPNEKTENPTDGPTSITEYYTITWVNDNGDVLETDVDVEKGTTPTYDGETPTKEASGNTKYYFNGWTPEVKEVTGDTTYTATYTEIIIENNGVGSVPVINENNRTIEYGLYPQTHVNDSALIETLNTLQPSTINNWYLYEDNYYCKEVAKVYNNETYTFDDGTTIINGETYWFKCEVISWDILKNTDGSYLLVTSKLLDTHNFYKDYNNRLENNSIVYANNYEQSDIRSWLNNYFFNTAFALNNSFVLEVNNDNSASTSDSTKNKYACATTLDKVFLPTYQDYLNNDYGFTSDTSVSKTRECKTTDYARARGAWYNTTNQLKFNGSYWTRTATSEYSYCAWNINSAGFISTYAVDGNSHCVRPSIYINL